MRGRPQKEFQEYLTDPGQAHVSHQDYISSPATAFLKYTIEAKSSIDQCINNFPKKKDKTYTEASLDSLQHLVAAMLPAVMGHFETFERHLFAGIFDRSVYLNNFDIDGLFKKLSKRTDVIFDPIRLAALRRTGASSIGILLADSLSGWHDPGKVNSLFCAFGLKRQFFSDVHSDHLRVLWQLRHSIVHTGGTLTLPDAQKVNALSGFGDQKVVFEKNFIYEVARKLHRLVEESTTGIGAAFNERLINPLDADVTNDIDRFFETKSSVGVWLMSP